MKVIAVRQPRRLAGAIGKVTAKTYRKRGFAATNVIAEWPAIVGADIARRTLPERLSAEGSLRVRVDGPIATELKHLEPQILERISQYFGYRAVHRLHLVRGPLPRTPDPAPRPARRPLDPEAEIWLAKTLEGTRDERLRAALMRLGRLVAAREGTAQGLESD